MRESCRGFVYFNGELHSFKCFEQRIFTILTVGIRAFFSSGPPPLQRWSGITLGYLPKLIDDVNNPHYKRPHDFMVVSVQANELG